MPLHRTTTVAAAACTPLLVATLLSAPAHAAGGDLVLRDRTGDGTPDITRTTVEHLPRHAARVTVKVRGVRSSVFSELVVFVDPDAVGGRPEYALTLPLNSASEWARLRTSGWRLGRDAGDCGERVRLLEPTATTRTVVVTLPRACFRGSAARFAVRANRVGPTGGVSGNADWTPGVRTLSRRFVL